MAQKIIDIDGSYLEGGGQIFRNALSLSCILSLPVRIYSIRANRPNPGINHQHLQCLNLLQQITSAEVKGNFLKSTEVTFIPAAIKAGKYEAIAQTAASITLIMQCAIPVVAFANKPSQLDLGGGTNVKMAPQLEYCTEVFRKLQAKFGLDYMLYLQQRGYYPKGGGRLMIGVEPVKRLQAIELLDFGKVQEIRGGCFVAGSLPLELAQQMKQAAKQVLAKVDSPRNISAFKESRKLARNNGSGIVLCCTTNTGCILGADALGERVVQPQQMGESAAKNLLHYIKNQVCVDEHAQDQLIIYMALAEGHSSIRTCKLTNHTLTAISVAQSMTKAVFEIKEKSDTQVIISCQGIGFLNKFL